MKRIEHPILGWLVLAMVMGGNHGVKDERNVLGIVLCLTYDH